VLRAPSVSVVIANWNGAAHLRECLDSLLRVDYPHDRFEVVVVDNGSTDGSRSLLEREYPSVRLIPLDRNLGFAAASNAGARAASSECVVFLNNDMRVEPNWLRELVALYEPDEGYVCVAGTILDWDGSRIGFTRGWVNYLGFAGQDHYLEPLDEQLIEDRADLLFACGGSMLIGREVFLDLGGFDPSYFALFEDVDLGWRLWLSGYRVRLAGKSRVQHRHHATASQQPLHRLAVLYERNALSTLIKNVDDRHLAPILVSALFMLAKRALTFTKSAREPFVFGAADDAPAEMVQRYGLAPLHAVSELLADLPQVLERREEVQRQRRRSDAEIFTLFNRPFVPFTLDESYVEAGLNLRAAFGLDGLFATQRAMRAVVVADRESARLRDISRSLSALTSTSSVSPASSGDVLAELLAEADLVVVDATTNHAAAIAEQSNGLVVVDLDLAESPPPDPLVQRGDVFLSARRGVHVPGVDAEVVVVTGESQTSALMRELVNQPLHWRRGEQHRVAVPEDLQELLRLWREHYRGGGPARRILQAASRWLPSRAERSLRRLLRRPRLSAQ
jgi:GT2 family glycosyltransferase